MLYTEGLSYSRTRVNRQDGTFYNVVEVTANNLDQVDFHKGINEPRDRKLHDVIHLRTLKALSRGISKPIIIAWDAYSHLESCNDFEPSKASDDLIHLSNNALISHHLRYLLESRNYLIEDGKLRVKRCLTSKDTMAQEILDNLYSQERIQVSGWDPSLPMEEVYANFDPKRDLIPVGHLGFPSTYARKENHVVVFNTSYFLFEEEDYISEFSLFGDAYNLQISNGVIESPPLYKRSSLLFKSDGGVELVAVSLQDLKISFLDQEWDLAQQQIFTRYSHVLEHDHTMTHTPIQLGTIHFIIIDRSVVGYKQNGGVEIPHNGFVLALPLEQIPLGTFSNLVSYSFSNGQSYRLGIQTGPGLIRDGQVILDQNTLVREQFFRKRIVDGEVQDYGIVPTDYAPDIVQTRAARAVIGVGAQGEFKVLAVESVNQGMAEVYGESSGVTLAELALLAKNRNYHYALNLDGGGSATIDYMYGKLVKGADRRGLPGVTYERMVPSVGVISR